MRQISHPNIVTLYDVFNSNSKTCLVIDLFDGGTLFDRINEKEFTESEACKIFTEMIDALNYLHNQCIVHRDIKPENFLFVSRDNNAAVKLIDFGFAGSCKNNVLKTQCGTPQYSAPEILGGIAYGIPSDMWSIGVILYIMLCGSLPFNDKNEQRLYKKIQSAEYNMLSTDWGNISKNAKDVVTRLLKTDPAKRLTAQQVLQHKWLNDYANKKVYHEPKIVSVTKVRNIRPSEAKRIRKKTAANNEMNTIEGGETEKIKTKHESDKYDDDVVDELVNMGVGARDEIIFASKHTVNYKNINDVLDTIDKIKDKQAYFKLNGKHFGNEKRENK
eukprot:406973_1